jgi:hypothetical protein
VRYVNKLGMKFVPVPITGGPTSGQRVLFNIWETRVQDYDCFIRETKREWRGPTQPPHPRFRWPQAGSTEAAIYVSWLDAKAFCEWLSQKDRSVGFIGDDLAYRLPTDHEWSCAVGLGDKEDPAISPRQKSDLYPAVFPWGTSWPPPSGAGNLADQKARAEGAYAHQKAGQEFIDGYDDGHAFIAPVGSFQPNRFGLHDLAGNVEEYVDDWFAAAKSERVIRGAHWGAASPHLIKASFRNGCVETSANHLVGFRVVLAPQPVQSAHSPASADLSLPSLVKQPVPMASATPASTAAARTIDLLALVDVKRDAIAGNWSHRGGELAVDLGSSSTTGSGGPRLQLPYQPPSEYDFEMEFTATHGNRLLGQLISVQGCTFNWILAGGDESQWTAGFELFDNKPTSKLPETATVMPDGIQNGRRYHSRVEVRTNTLCAFLDRKQLVRWSGDFRRLANDPTSHLYDKFHLGLLATSRAVIFHKVTVHEITGTGTIDSDVPARSRARLDGKPVSETAK